MCIETQIRQAYGGMKAAVVKLSINDKEGNIDRLPKGWWDPLSGDRGYEGIQCFKC